MNPTQKQFSLTGVSLKNEIPISCDVHSEWNNQTEWQCGRSKPVTDRRSVRLDREKCVHCGACLWNCSQANPENPERMNIAFRAGTGGLHSAEN